MRLRSVLVASALAILASPAAAHHGHAELGHHLEIPAYTHEIQSQLAGMAAVSAGLLLTKLISRKAK